MTSSLDRVYKKHATHQAQIKLRTFRNGTTHWELRCRDCDAHIQWLKQYQASWVDHMIEIEKPWVDVDELWGYGVDS